MEATASAPIEALIRVLGVENVITEPAAIARSAKDSSWLSPVLSEAIGLTGGKQATLPTFGFKAVVKPHALAQLRELVQCCYEYALPMVVRGGATSNFGQIIGREGGILIDLRGLGQIVEITPEYARVEGGCLMGPVQDEADKLGRELTVLTTTWRHSTAAGWIAGGHVGLGADSFGTIWDGNVLGAKVMTVEPEPRIVTLEREHLAPVLHTYGTTGIITEVTLPLVPQHAWREQVIVFEQYPASVDFVAALSEETAFAKRVVAAQPPALAAAYRPLQGIIPPGSSVVLSIIDQAGEDTLSAAASAFGGRVHPWNEGDEATVSLAQMVYGHRLLWVKKAFPECAFFHVYFDPTRFREQLDGLAERFGDALHAEFKYIRSGFLRKLFGHSPEGTLPVSALALLPAQGATLEAVIGACNGLGIHYMNPHTFYLDDSGFFPDFGPILEFKRMADPRGLLNPGKISPARFTPER